MIRILLCGALCLATSVALAASYRLAPWKDDLFSYPAVIENHDDGAYLRVAYSKQRDLYERDQVPERQVWSKYVSLVSQRVRNYDGAGIRLKFLGFGRVDGGAHAVVIYVHGQGGSRFQGADQGTFGGNFNRIMNLMERNGGAYISPDFTDLHAAGTADIKALVLDQAARSPGAAIFVACGSQGGSICWGLAADAEVTPHLAGLLLLGSSHDDAFLSSPMVTGGAPPIPLFIGHGTEDPIFAWQDEVAFYKRLRAANPRYPVQIVLFDSGVHGTPIRMVDWRSTLNWMLEADGL